MNAYYADDSVIHCQNKLKADKVLKELEARLRECGLEMHPEKTQIVYCKDSNRNERHLHSEFDFLGLHSGQDKRRTSIVRRPLLTGCPL